LELASAHPKILKPGTEAILERITYDPDGTPHFWSADTNPPTVTRIAWTGDGTLPTGDTVTAQAFEIGLSEAIDPESVADATATLTPDGGSAVSLTAAISADGRGLELTGATITAGTAYTLHLEGVTDTSHNPISLLTPDQTITVTDPNTYEVLSDDTAPTLVAVMGGSDALYLSFDEPIEASAGFDLTTAVEVSHNQSTVAGTTTRISPKLLKWEPASGSLAGVYDLSALHFTDLAGNVIDSPEPSVTVPGTSSDQLLFVLYAAPTDSTPESASQYGLTTLFQGRTWHADLGMYSYRARWYLPEAGVFGERDPVVRLGGEQNLYVPLKGDHANVVDPHGTQPAHEDDDDGKWHSEAHNLTPYSTQLYKLLERFKRRISSGGDTALATGKAVLDQLGSLVENWLFLASPANMATDYLAGGLLDLAEHYKGTAGGSAEGAGVFGPFGAHRGINWQYFPPPSSDLSRTYRLAFFDFSTTKNFAAQEIENGRGKGLGVLGVLYSAGLSLNVAKGFQENEPEKWAGYFNTVSASWKSTFPVPSGASAFWSSNDLGLVYAGGELSWGGGIGFAWSHPYFNELGFTIRCDRGTAQALLSSAISLPLGHLF